MDITYAVRFAVTYARAAVKSGVWCSLFRSTGKRSALLPPMHSPQCSPGGLLRLWSPVSETLGPRLNARRFPRNSLSSFNQQQTPLYVTPCPGIGWNGCLQPWRETLFHNLISVEVLSYKCDLNVPQFSIGILVGLFLINVSHYYAEYNYLQMLLKLKRN